MAVDNDRLHRLLGGDDTLWIVERARERIERGRSPWGTAVLADPTPTQRTAAARLLGRPPSRARALSVSLAEVHAVLRDSGAASGLVEAVEALSKRPLRDLPADQAAADTAWRVAFAPLQELTAVRPELAPWRDHLTGRGVLRRLAGSPGAAAELVQQAVAAVQLLPAEQLSRADLALAATRDEHALDDSRPLAGLVLRAASLLSGVPLAPTAESRREVWASIGVVTSDLAGPVLTLGLAGNPATATGRAVAAWRDASQPVYLTLRQLRAEPEPLILGPGTTVFVCENPSVVAAAADHLGARCPPLVCVQGQPSVATRALLSLLRAQRARLRYHGDFDWGGVTIANTVIHQFGAFPWRYDVAAYEAARASGRGAPLAGRRTEAIWDDALAVVMESACQRIAEEDVLADLLADLSSPQCSL